MRKFFQYSWKNDLIVSWLLVQFNANINKIRAFCAENLYAGIVTCFESNTSESKTAPSNTRLARTTVHSPV